MMILKHYSDTDTSWKKIYMEILCNILTRLMVVAVACDTLVNMITSVPSITSHPLPLQNRVVLVFELTSPSGENKRGPMSGKCWTKLQNGARK